VSQSRIIIWERNIVKIIDTKGRSWEIKIGGKGKRDISNSWIEEEIKRGSSWTKNEIGGGEIWEGKNI